MNPRTRAIITETAWYLAASAAMTAVLLVVLAATAGAATINEDGVGLIPPETVVADSDTILPVTGVDPWPLAALGAAFIAWGAIALFARRDDHETLVELWDDGASWATLTRRRGVWIVTVCLDDDTVIYSEAFGSERAARHDWAIVTAELDAEVDQ